MQLQRLGDLVPHQAKLVQGDQGVLQDEADLAAPDLPPRALRLTGQVDSAQVDPVRRDLGARPGEADQGARGDALARP